MPDPSRSAPHPTHKWRLCPSWRRPRLWCGWTGRTGAEGMARWRPAWSGQQQQRGGGGDGGDGLHRPRPWPPARSGPGLHTETQRRDV